MRAIKIDPVAKTITEIELAQNPNETLQELYDLIGCDLVELVQLDRSSWRWTKKANSRKSRAVLPSSVGER